MASFVLTAATGSWLGGLAHGRFAGLGFLAAVTVGVGVFLRQDRWQGETNIAAHAESGTLGEEPFNTDPDFWPRGLFGVVWLP